jgi:hypothetical protein
MCMPYGALPPKRSVVATVFPRLDISLPGDLDGKLLGIIDSGK